MVAEKPSEGQETALRAYEVCWGCVDWDMGEEEASIHARNVQETLRQLNIASWIERSRSKGYHLWVFFTEPVPARPVREGLIAVCNIVDAPITEVNPKQIELTGKGWGNGVRLPYPKGAAEGRNTVVTFPPMVPEGDLTVDEFVDRAMRSRITPHEWGTVHTLYRPPPRCHLDKPTRPATRVNSSGWPERSDATAPATRKKSHTATVPQPFSVWRALW